MLVSRRNSSDGAASVLPAADVTPTRLDAPHHISYAAQEMVETSRGEVP